MLAILLTANYVMLYKFSTKVESRFTIDKTAAVMDQRGGRPSRKRITAGTLELLIRLKRDVYADPSVLHF